MAAIITSPSESRRFEQSPEEYAKVFSLSAAESASLIEMGADLRSLTASFVNKRSRSLRWNARRTIELLGPDGDALVDEFVDANPMTDWFRVEARLFSDFMIERASALQDGSPRSRLIAEMARFDKHRSDAFWDAVSPLESSEGSMIQTAQNESIRLRAGATIGQFGWDLRLPYWRNIEPLEELRPDPCHLLFFFTTGLQGTRVIRLCPGEEVVVRAMRPGDAVPISQIREVVPDGRDCERILSRFLRGGAIEWV